MKPIVTLALTFLFLQGLAQPTIDQFMSAPSASGLAVSADGKQLAWILNERGKRNIFFRNTTGQTRQLTSYDQDDGQELSQLTFSPDGSRLIFVRGGDQSREGHSPNPSSLAEGVDQAIWCAVLATNEIYKLAVGSEPVFYPDGKNLLFSKGPQIQTIAVEKGSVPSQLFFSRGNNGDPRFSPDGKEIVFVSYRRDHNFIGVYTLATKKIRWISPEVSMDLIPVWSPDGKRIAFIRMPGLRADELISFVGGRKFSVWVADAATGKGAAIWNSPADDGGFAQMYPSPLLSWTKTDRLLFFSEHEGWDHVYSIRPDGSDIRDITPGNGEVESYTLDAAGANIYFDGNREDIDRRHIWKSGVADGKVLAVTSGEGIEMYPSLAGTELYCMRSTINQPAAVTRYEEKTRKFESLSALSSPSFASQGFVRPEQVIFKSPDGTTVHGQLFIDRAIKGKRPGLVFMHGGPIRQMLLGFHYSNYYSNCYAFNQYLASVGYAVIAVNYRDGIGYGRNFRRAKDQGPWGASEYQDIVAAGKFLQGLPEVEVTKIGLWGGSYGGYLTAMGLARNPELFKAGVDLHGVHDWSFRAREFSPGGGWGITGTDMGTAYLNSPVSDLSKWTAPVLLVCGDDDRNVLFQETTDLAERLREKKIPTEILVLPDEVHGFLRYESWRQVFEAARDFFDRKLKG
ncbi:MAG: S9 family peptidase [Cyclobacteriaceae bacterium]|nr:S9 family peptidase [Cyclobacteriaceae bacterium]